MDIELWAYCMPAMHYQLNNSPSYLPSAFSLRNGCPSLLPNIYLFVYLFIIIESFIYFKKKKKGDSIILHLRLAGRYPEAWASLHRQNWFVELTRDRLMPEVNKGKLRQG